MPPGKLKILDIGCGNGFLSGKLSDLGHSIDAFDVSEEGIKIACNSFPLVNFSVRSVYDSTEDFAKDYDLVVSSEVIEHLYDPNVLADKAYQHLKPGGSFILTTPYHEPIPKL